MTTDVVIVDAVRTPMGRSKAGAFRNVRAEDLSAHLIRALLKRNAALNPSEIEDVIWGCVQQTKEQGFNIARMALLQAGLPISVAGQTVNRLCGSSMTAIHAAVSAIRDGIGDTYICGGVEHMGHVPMDYNIDPNPAISLVAAKASGMMGLTAEMLATMFSISRKAQDEFALQSHQRAIAAQKSGEFRNEMVPLEGHDADGLPMLVDFDEVARADASLEGLGALRPVFNPKGSVTAGTGWGRSAGGAAWPVMSARRAKALGLRSMVKLRAMASAGSEPATLCGGPVPDSRRRW